MHCRTKLFHYVPKMKWNYVCTTVLFFKLPLLSCVTAKLSRRKYEKNTLKQKIKPHLRRNNTICTLIRAQSMLHLSAHDLYDLDGNEIVRNSISQTMAVNESRSLGYTNENDSCLIIARTIKNKFSNFWQQTSVQFALTLLICRRRCSGVVYNVHYTTVVIFKCNDTNIACIPNKVRLN